MKRGARVLWRSQANAAAEILDHIHTMGADTTRVVLLDAPTGSGKTTIALTVACKLLELGSFDAVLVLTPQTDIRANFKIGVVIVPGEDNAVGWSVDGSNAVVSQLPRVSWVDQIREHVTHPRKSVIGGPVDGGILVCCHPAGVYFHKNEDFNGAQWDRVLVIIDEAHHVSANYRDQDAVGEEQEDCRPFKETEIGKFCQAIQARGATILLATATPYRANSLEVVYPEGARLVTISYAEYAADSGAPNDLHIELVGPKDPGALQDHVVQTESQLAGDVGARYSGDAGLISEQDARRLAARVVSDGRRMSKSFICIPRVNPRTSIDRIYAALEAEWPGVRVFDATGDRADELTRELKHEQGCTRYQESRWDVIIVCRRGTEGTDWPFCSHFYHVGFIASIPKMKQTLGRTARSKKNYPDYPNFLRDVATLTVFAPRMNDNLVERVKGKWHKLFMLSACFIHSHEVARVFLGQVRIQLSTSVAKSVNRGEAGWASVVSRLNRVMPGDIDFARGERLVGSLELSLHAKNGRGASVAEVVHAIQASECDSDGLLTAKVKTAAVLLCLQTAAAAGEDHQVAKDVEVAVRSFVHKLLRVDRSEEHLLDTLLLEGFEEVAKKWERLTSARVNDQIEVLSRVRAQETPLLYKDLREAIMPTPFFKQACRVAKKWYEEHRMGTVINGDLSRYFGRHPGSYTAKHLKQDIKARALPGQPDHIRSWTDFAKYVGLD